MRKNNWAHALMLVSQLGFSMVTPIIVCTFIGIFIDNKAHTEPWVMIVFVILGVGGAYRNLFYLINKQIKKGDKDE